MKYGLRILFCLILFISSVSSVFSAGQCCYIPESSLGIREVILSDTCAQGEIPLGDPDFSNFDNPCKQYHDQRLGCVNDGVCTETVQGNVIYDIPAVLNSFPFNNYCSSFRDFDDQACNGNRILTIGGGGNNQGNTGNPTTGGGNSGNPFDFDLLFNKTRAEAELSVQCAGSGGPFGFYGTRTSCEAVVIGNNESCLFNPYLGGRIITNLDFVNSKSIKSFENACIPKSEIKTCFDYKTEENCNVNPSINYSVELKAGCNWILSSEFMDGHFEDISGVCISNSITPLKNFNELFYSFRFNLIKNPSFEDGNSYWNNFSESNIVPNPSTYHGSNSLIIPKDSSISQLIEKVNPGISFSSSVYVKVKSLNNNPQIRLTLQVVDDNGTEISSETQVETVILSQVFTDYVNVFKKVSFNGFNMPQGSSKVLLTISSVNDDIEIDAVSFEAFSTQSDVTSSPIFKPVEIISSKASTCGLCYDKNNLNSCTPDKAELLGDCEYMVDPVLFGSYSSKLPNYFGKDRNIYSKEDPYAYQAIPRSKLFCELYVSEESCVDPTNYVNSKFTSEHKLSGPTLCKYDETYGCYKDSDNDRFPDTRQGVPFLRAFPEENKQVFKSFSLYNYNNKASGIISDFDSACDVLPPNAYVYFTAKNQSGDEILLESGNEELVGSVMIHMEVNDVLLESCQDFAMQNKIYLDYRVNDKTGFRTVNSNTLKELYPLKNYFTNRNDENAVFDESIIVDGINDISLQIKDQSGNLARDLTYEFNIDANAPKIELVSHNTVNGLIPQVLGPETVFDFYLNDYSGISSCSYKLTPLSPVPQSYYTGQGNLNLNNISEDGILNFKLPIFDSSPNPDVYKLNVSCTDIFDQRNSQIYGFYVDYDTSIVIIDPVGFLHEDFDFGYLNSPRSFVGASTEKNLNSCQISFRSSDGFTGSYNLPITKVANGFTINRLGYENILFYSDISGDISFSYDGTKKGQIKCYDSFSNEFIENITYIYDTVEPEFSNLKVSGPSISGKKTIIESNGNYYTRTNKGALLDLTIDGTGSWLSKIMRMVPISEDGELDDIYPKLIDTQINNQTYIGHLLISNFELSDIVYIGLDTEEDNLQIMKYLIEFTDKAGNFNSEIINYFYDTSNPEFKFSGDIISQDGDTIYSRNNNPKIDVSFNTPSYRTYSCRITGKSGNLLFEKSFPTSNKVNFTLTDISNQFSVDEDHRVDLTFDCRDIYNMTQRNTYTLVYDNTRPILKNIFLANGNNKYFKNFENLAYDDIVDDIVFDLENTKEIGYTCKYKVLPTSDVYSCNSSIRTVKFTNSGFQKDSNLLLVAGSRSQRDDAICIRTSEFERKQNVTLGNNAPFETSLFLEGTCYDKVNFSTLTKKAVININYVTGDLAGLEFEYRDGFAYPIVTSFSPFPTVKVGFNELGKNPEVVLFNPRERNGLYRYESPEGIELINLEDGSHLMFAVAVDNNDNVLEYVSGYLVVDRVPPTGNIEIPDESKGIVYSDEFQLNVNAFDENGEIDTVELYLENELLYSTANESSYNDKFLAPPLSNLNYFSPDFSSYTGTLGFKGEVGRVYTFRLKVKDTGGNTFETFKTVQILNGLGITLTDSNNAKVDPTKFVWATNVNSPTINFEISVVADSCIVKPFVNKFWESITGDNSVSELRLEKRNSNKFSFDLSQFEQYDLSKVTDKKSTINIICLYNNTYYNYTRTIAYIDYIPDYVLTSEEGFVFNEEPFSTTINVKSVGPYRFITCKYGIDDESLKSFNEENSIYFSKKLDFTFIGSGVHLLTLVCEDIVGNKGPTKTYEFSIDKESALDIEDIKLKNNADTFSKQENNIIYVNDVSNLDLEFKLNKKNDISCSYIINSDTKLSGVINFFKNLFNIGSKQLPESNAFVFNAKGLNFDAQTNNILRIECNSLASSDGFAREYSVRYSSSELNISSTLSSIE